MGRWKKANVIRGNKYGAAAPTGGGFLEKKGHTSHRPAGVKSCITAIQSIPQFLGMGPTHSSLKITKEDAKKWGRSREHVPLTLLAYGLNAAAHTGQTRRAWVDFSGFW